MLTVNTTIKCPVSDIWDARTNPKHIVNWYFASDDWHVPYAENDLRVGGKFKITLSAKDKSESFDFEGVYTNILDYKLIEYSILDSRKVSIVFSTKGSETTVSESFEPENVNPLDVQEAGWKCILDNFKKYVETKL